MKIVGRERHKSQGEWLKEGARKHSKELGAAEWYQKTDGDPWEGGADGSGGEEAAWGEEQPQLGHSRRRDAGTQNSPRWVCFLTHLVPSVASDKGTREKAMGIAAGLCEGT